jgi:multicomponent Na+:H+ antiporter subunit F
VSAWMIAFASFLLLTVFVGMIRIWRGPTAADRMLATQLFTTTGTAILLLLSDAMSNPTLRDVALVSAILASISTVVFVRRWPRLPDSGLRRSR